MVIGANVANFWFQTQVGSPCFYSSLLLLQHLSISICLFSFCLILLRISFTCSLGSVLVVFAASAHAPFLVSAAGAVGGSNFNGRRARTIIGNVAVHLAANLLISASSLTTKIKVLVSFILIWTC